MTEPSTAGTEVPTAPIMFQGREMFIQVPRPEQILVWKRTLDGLQRPEVQSWNGAQVLAALERTRKIIDSLLVNQADIDWLDDEMLAGRLGLVETAGIITEAVKAFQTMAAEMGNREERRANAKATKKAARKTPAKKAAAKKAGK